MKTPAATMMICVAYAACLLVAARVGAAPRPAPHATLAPRPEASHRAKLARPLVSGAPIDPAQLTCVRFGCYSHWLQPWRAYLETMPATQFLNGLGIVLNSHRGEDPNQILRMCAAHGIRHARIEIGWSSFDYHDETKLHNAKDYAARLLACKANGIRPLILLNGNHGAPCPLLFFSRKATADAPAGSRHVMLDRTDGLVIGHSGLTDPHIHIAAQFLIIHVAGHTVTLSQPLKHAIAAGSTVPMATLKYAPFGDPATPEGQATLDGWKRYARSVAKFAAKTLGTTGQSDLGFDLEIWNEMSFGSCFIFQRYYYNPLPHPYDQNGTYLRIVRATADEATAEPALFAGVRLVDGFSNTLPWPASSQEPARVTALSHHPYAGRKVFPKDKSKGTPLNALGLVDHSGFVPSYQERFPEYFATAIQTETIVRDMAPITTEIYRVKHGRYTRPGNPCWCWITEVNYAPDEDGVTDTKLALRLKAKAIARYYCFYLNKGVQELYLYATGANDPRQGDRGLGVLLQAFVDRTRTHKTYPADDGPWTSPALRVTARIAREMRDGLDANLDLKHTRRLKLVSITDTHNHEQFAGDPSNLRARPPLYDRDVFAFLPFQVNAKRFVIPYYVMTRDIRRDLAAEKFTVTVKGLDPQAHFSVYDPFRDTRETIRALPAENGAVRLELSATDYPRLLEVN